MPLGAFRQTRRADDVNILGGKKNTEASVIASKQTALEVNDWKTKYMVMSWDQNAGQNINIHMGNKSFETAEQFKYLATNLMNQNSIHEEIKSRLKSADFIHLFSKKKNWKNKGFKIAFII